MSKVWYHRRLVSPVAKDQETLELESVWPLRQQEVDLIIIFFFDGDGTGFVWV